MRTAEISASMKGEKQTERKRGKQVREVRGMRTTDI